jgi:hypothetical protein
MKMTLYLKTHNQTGLKYLGKTVGDPFSYKGSGKIWQRHLKKHGDDHTTKILLETDDPSELRKWGLYYSNFWNIVESKEFANLCPEMGSGGDTSMTDNYKNGLKRRDTSGSKNSMYGRSAIVENNIRWYNNGIENVYVPAGTEPTGFVPGRIINYKKPHNESTKKLISEANGKACVSPVLLSSSSLTEAAKAYNVSKQAIAGSIARGVSGWKRVS